jgi:hypothetical protein
VVLASALIEVGRVDEALEAARNVMARRSMRAPTRSSETLRRFTYAELLRAAGLEAEPAEAPSAAREHLHARAGKIANPALRERLLRSHPGMPILGPRSRERSRVG